MKQRRCTGPNQGWDFSAECEQRHRNKVAAVTVAASAAAVIDLTQDDAQKFGEDIDEAFGNVQDSHDVSEEDLEQIFEVLNDFRNAAAEFRAKHRRHAVLVIDNINVLADEMLEFGRRASSVGSSLGRCI
jgi:type VI protein secretion system component VasK